MLGQLHDMDPKHNSFPTGLDNPLHTRSGQTPRVSGIQGRQCNTISALPHPHLRLRARERQQRLGFGNLSFAEKTSTVSETSTAITAQEDTWKKPQPDLSPQRGQETFCCALMDYACRAVSPNTC